MRDIIDLPRALMRAVSCDWDIEWRGQDAGEGVDGSEQIISNAPARWIGSPTLALHGDLIGQFRALRARARGRVNAWRLPMIDTVISGRMVGLAGRALASWQNGYLPEVRPVVFAVNAAAAGAEQIVIDERQLAHPIKVGAILSQDDWPFMVVDRSGAGAAVTLQIEMPLRRGFAAGAAIDLFARGIFIAAGDGIGNPVYGLDRVARPDLSFVEWIARP